MATTNASDAQNRRRIPPKKDAPAAEVPAPEVPATPPAKPVEKEDRGFFLGFDDDDDTEDTGDQAEGDE